MPHGKASQEMNKEQIPINIGIDLSFRDPEVFSSFYREGIGRYIENCSREFTCAGNSVILITFNSRDKRLRSLARQMGLEGQCNFISPDNATLYYPEKMESVIIGCAHAPTLICNENLRLFDIDPRIKCLSSSPLRNAFLKVTLACRKSMTSKGRRVCAKATLIVLTQERITKYEKSFEVPENSEVIELIFSTNEIDPELCNRMYLDVCTAQNGTGIIISEHYTRLEPMDGPINGEIARQIKVNFTSAISNSVIDVLWGNHPAAHLRAPIKPYHYHCHDLITLVNPELYKGLIADADRTSESIKALTVLRPSILKKYSVSFSADHILKEHIMPFSPMARAGLLEHEKIECPPHSVRCIKVNTPDIADSIQDSILGCKPYVTYPTQARPGKRLDKLIDIAQNLSEDGIKIILTCKIQDFKKVVNNKIPDNIYFMADLSVSELRFLYSNACATVITTDFEGSFPWQFMESVLEGTPAFVSSKMLEYVPDYLSAIAPELSKSFTYDDIHYMLKRIKVAAGLANEEDELAALRAAVDLIIRQEKSIRSWEDTAKQHYESFCRSLRTTEQRPL